MKAKPGKNGGNRWMCGALLVCAAVLSRGAWGQGQTATPALPQAPALQTPSFQADSQVAHWEGMPIRRISFAGVLRDRLRPLPEQFQQMLGKPLERRWLQRCLRELFATALYETVEVSATGEGDGVALLFTGPPRTFVGVVTVDGAKGASLNTQLLRASRLSPGTRFTPARLNLAQEYIRRTMADHGFHDPVITDTLTPDPNEQLVDIAFHVVNGPQARIGAVEVAGDPGMSAEEFRRKAHLGEGSHVQRDTTNRALAGVLKHYQKQNHLEAEIKLEAQQYDSQKQRSNYRFLANRGPQVKVKVDGINVSGERLKRIIPIYEEGTVDDDLLNEGNRRLRDYCQRLGYFDVKVDHERQSPGPDQVVIVYKVTLGERRRVEKVTVTGNHYFDSATLEELLSVHTADSTDRHGAYSQSLVAADVSALETVYHNNGFPSVKITHETSSPAKTSAKTKAAPLVVVYHIDEGRQVQVGVVKLDGVEHSDPAKLMALLNTASGQLLSPQSLAGDRDALLTDYLSRGFDQVVVEVEQLAEAADPTKVDVTFRITEGQQIFVRKVLVTGLHYTRPDTIAKAITLHPGDPLSQPALVETQRNLYEFALFNGIDTAIQNPNGGEIYKTVLLQATEARRWALTYGFGFEVQTGNPQYNCGASCQPNGKTGVSPRVLLDITRNNLFGREQSVSLRGTYGLLEQRVNLLFQNPHFEGNRNWGLTLSAGYANSRDVTTYVASRMETSVRWTEHFATPVLGFSRANTFVYEYDFRRVKVAKDSLQVNSAALEQLSTAVRVAGPGLTWIRDTRDSPLDAHRGTYTSFQEFFSSTHVGAQAQFNRLDVSNSSYHGFDKGRYVLARNTRYGQERAFGNEENILLPLPERLYAGGPVSLRGFSVNAAGPRDPQTGFPIGGAGALVNSTEMRLPPPTLPWFGDTLSFVLFHDMGNVFANASDAWVSATRIHQPERNTCKDLSTDNLDGSKSSIGQLGKCRFDYFSHATGLGVRYHTPVGPIRLDFSYNLNPPIYPVIGNSTQTFNPPDRYVGEVGHFNFFFSLGQTF